MSHLADLARGGDLAGLRTALADQDVPGVVDELERSDRLTRAVAFRALPKDQALAVFEDLDPELQGELLNELRGDDLVDLLESLDPDDRAGLLDELPASVATRLLNGLSPDERAMTTALLGYPAESAGRRMSPEVVAVPAGLAVGQALQHVRRYGKDAEMIYMLPVVGPGRTVVGVVSLRRLFGTDDDVLVEQILSEPVMVRATDDQEAAARVVRDHGALAVPVVDAEDRLLGLLTVDDAMRILEEEESEDLARTGASEPLHRPYLATSVLGLVRARIAWLLVLIPGRRQLPLHHHVRRCDGSDRVLPGCPGCSGAVAASDACHLSSSLTTRPPLTRSRCAHPPRCPQPTLSGSLKSPPTGRPWRSRLPGRDAPAHRPGRPWPARGPVPWGQSPRQ
jgi:magnesium transporter